MDLKSAQWAVDKIKDMNDINLVFFFRIKGKRPKKESKKGLKSIKYQNQAFYKNFNYITCLS